MQFSEEYELNDVIGYIRRGEYRDPAEVWYCEAREHEAREAAKEVQRLLANRVLLGDVLGACDLTRSGLPWCFHPNALSRQQECIRRKQVLNVSHQIVMNVLPCRREHVHVHVHTYIQQLFHLHALSRTQECICRKQVLNV